MESNINMETKIMLFLHYSNLLLTFLCRIKPKMINKIMKNHNNLPNAMISTLDKNNTLRFCMETLSILKEKLFFLL